MTDNTTTWQDMHSSKRGHQLMTQKLADTIPAIGATKNATDYDQVTARAKLFSPFSNWTWYITELDLETGRCFGLVEGLETELGYFDLTELAETTVFEGIPAVERDLYWKPRTLNEIKNGSQEKPPHNEKIRESKTMTEKIERKITPSDVLNVEEILFGTTTTDAPADTAEEPPAEDATDNINAAGEPDIDAECAEKPQTNTDDEEPATSAEATTLTEFKVVISIRNSRATIGVQQPAADPHIETFDDADLFELSDQFPAVVARAKARWKEQPMYPTYERPAPPARQRNRRQPATPPPADTGVDEKEPPQAETLRLF